MGDDKSAFIGFPVSPLSSHAIHIFLYVLTALFFSCGTHAHTESYHAADDVTRYIPILSHENEDLRQVAQAVIDIASAGSHSLLN